MSEQGTIYRVTIADLDCRRGAELLTLKVNETHGVEAASVRENVLTVLADSDTVSPTDLLRTIVEAGFSPASDVESRPVAAQAPVAQPGSPAAPIAEAPAVPVETPVAEVEEAPITAPVADAIEPQPIAEACEEPVIAQASLVQRVVIDVNDGFHPGSVTVVPGVPVEVVLGAASAAVAGVRFVEFGISTELGDGATVALPALAAGTYHFASDDFAHSGTIIARF